MCVRVNVQMKPLFTIDFKLCFGFIANFVHNPAKIFWSKIGMLWIAQKKSKQKHKI